MWPVHAAHSGDAHRPVHWPWRHGRGSKSWFRPGTGSRAQIEPHAGGAPLRVSGGAPGACVPLSTTPSYSWFSRESSTVPHHIAVFADAGYCGDYDLLIYVDPPHYSDALLAVDEPNDDCASATQIVMDVDDQGLPTRTHRTRMLHQDDVDYFRVSVPSGETYVFKLYRDSGVQVPRRARARSTGVRRRCLHGPPQARSARCLALDRRMVEFADRTERDLARASETATCTRSSTPCASNPST